MYIYYFIYLLPNSTPYFDFVVSNQFLSTFWLFNFNLFYLIYFVDLIRFKLI